MDDAAGVAAVEPGGDAGEQLDDVLEGRVALVQERGERPAREVAHGDERAPPLAPVGVELVQELAPGVVVAMRTSKGESKKPRSTLKAVSDTTATLPAALVAAPGVGVAGGRQLPWSTTSTHSVPGSVHSVSSTTPEPPGP